jgi:hypothetical protein
VLNVTRVVAYYNEPLDSLKDVIKQVTAGLPFWSSHRIIVYFKGDKGDEATFNELLAVGNEVVWLPNVGREGETYLVSGVEGFCSGGWDGGEYFRGKGQDGLQEGVQKGCVRAWRLEC